MKISNTYNIGDKIYLVVDPEQNQYLIVGIMVMPTNLLMYRITGSDGTDDYYDFELSPTKNILIGSEKDD